MRPLDPALLQKTYDQYFEFAQGRGIKFGCLLICLEWYPHLNLEKLPDNYNVIFVPIPNMTLLGLNAPVKSLSDLLRIEELREISLQDLTWQFSGYASYFEWLEEYTREVFGTPEGLEMAIPSQEEKRLAN